MLQTRYGQSWVDIHIVLQIRILVFPVHSEFRLLKDYLPKLNIKATGRMYGVVG